MESTSPDQFRNVVDLALKNGMTAAVIIDPKTVITAEWVRMKCQFGCNGFGRRLSCPPNTPTPETTKRMLSEYDHALFIHLSAKAQRIADTNINETVLSLERAAFFDGNYKAFGLGAGPCHLCDRCGERCNHPTDARPSMESCGIDVFGTARRHGFPISVLKERESNSNFYGLILIK